MSNRSKPPLYVTKYNKDASRFLNTCVACGRTGYAPQVARSDFALAGQFHHAIQRTLLESYDPLPLEEFGLCLPCHQVRESEGNEA